MNHTIEEILCQVITAKHTNEYTLFSVVFLLVLYIVKILIKQFNKNGQINKRAEHESTIQNPLI